MVSPEGGIVSDLYFLEKMIIERMREVQREAEIRTRVGIRHCRAQPTPRCFHKLVGGWLIRAGFRLQGARPDPAK